LPRNIEALLDPSRLSKAELSDLDIKEYLKQIFQDPGNFPKWCFHYRNPINSHRLRTDGNKH
jgi:hypothetical protein